MLKKKNNENSFDRMCRLCGSTDKPRQDIFGFSKEFFDTIQFLLKVTINEWDELPHKICFRCSAKVTDLQEFQAKCLDTQKTFRLHTSSKGPKKDGSRKSARDLWEEELKKKNLSNEEYCDELVKKALASVSNLRDNFNNSDDDIPVGLLKHAPLIPANVKFVNVKLKLQKVDSGNFKGVKKNRDGSYLILKDEEPSECEIPEHMSIIKVRGYGDYYSCKHCDNIVMDKESIKLHKCRKMKKETKKENKVEPQDKIPLTEHTKLAGRDSLTADILSNCLLVPIGNGAFAIKTNTNSDLAQNMKSDLPTKSTPYKSILNEFKMEDDNILQKTRDRSKLKSNEIVNLTNQPKLSSQSKYPATSTPTEDISVKKNPPRKRKIINYSDLFSDNSDKEKQLPTRQIPEKNNIKPALPYPVGLICRNVPETKLKKQNRQYEVLPPTTPGKLVIRSLHSIPTANNSGVNNDEHFFTFVDLNVAPNHLLTSEQSLQESQITTTKICNKQKKIKKTKHEFDDETKIYSCEICSYPFSNRKKLMAHVRTHFSHEII